MIAWIKQNYPEYHRVGIIALSEEQKADKRRFHTQEEDFKYKGLNVNIVKAFMSGHKFKPGTQIQYGFIHMRKYHNAIQHGASRAGEPLPQAYVIEMPKFLQSLKKEKNQAKKDGRLDEKEADPISFAFYNALCQMALFTGDIFLWAYTVCQWNCMARSINIDGLSFGQFSLGMDSTVIEFYDSKSFQTGEKTVPKNCYSNPFDMKICISTALGCYFSTQEEVWNSGRDTIFRSKTSKAGTASHIYNSKLHKLFNGPMQQMVPDYVRPSHANSHGFRKGGGTYVTSGTTCPPPISSVAGRGEWSMGKVFDVYWTFAQTGDQYLGKILAGFDPNSGDFACFPPRFIVGMENIYVKNAMESSFKNIIERCMNEFPNIQGVLLTLTLTA